MELYFNLFLKGVTSVIILYIAFNTIFRYHPSIRLTDLIAIVIFTIVSYFFIGSFKIVAYAIVIGVALLIYLVTKLVLRKKHIDFVFLHSIAKSDREMFQSAISETESKLNLPKQEISNIRNLAFLIKINDNCKKRVKTFLKELYQLLAKKPKRFGYYQYFHIIFALILMAAIWRF